MWPRSFQALTLVKTCEPVAEMRECRASRDWSLLALQNVRTGKSHYLVICRCPDTNILGERRRHFRFNLISKIRGGQPRKNSEKRGEGSWVLTCCSDGAIGTESNFLDILRSFFAEGPMSHDQPTYASVPGIRVYGMMCVQGNRRGRPLRYSRSVSGMHSKLLIGFCPKPYFSQLAFHPLQVR